MNISPLNTNSYSFYDSANRINVNSARHIDATGKVEESSKISADKAEDVKSEKSYVREDYAGPQHTEVSADNSYQKTMLSDKGFAMERLAGKLLNKLPQIFKDMSKLSSMPSAEATENTSSKVVISENKNDYLEQQAKNAELQDISLENIKL